MSFSIKKILSNLAQALSATEMYQARENIGVPQLRELTPENRSYSSQTSTLTLEPGKSYNIKITGDVTLNLSTAETKADTFWLLQFHTEDACPQLTLTFVGEDGVIYTIQDRINHLQVNCGIYGRKIGNTPTFRLSYVQDFQNF